MKYRNNVFLKGLYLWGRDSLRESLAENPELESSLLLSKALGINAIDIYAHPEREVESEKVEEFKLLLERRLKREPIAYILGEKEFYSRPFVVTPDVLIPRPETEILVEEALKISKSIPQPLVVDAGTGSGCISVTIACECRDARILATDISLESLLIAEINSRRHGTLDRISLVRMDFLSGFKEESIDIVLSNPPYISKDDFSKLESSVRDFEPKESLLGGEDGLDYIRKIVYQSRRVLKNGGWCIVEVGAGQSEGVSEILDYARFKSVSSVKDISGIERVVKGKWIR
ncbi:MAG: peptide chain release factor N(5)-glutamine methyltransferase [Candidatus Dadabacteria bacterium]